MVEKKNMIADDRELNDNRNILTYQEIIDLYEKQVQIEEEIREIKNVIVTKADLSEFMKLFDIDAQHEEP